MRACRFALLIALVGAGPSFAQWGPETPLTVRTGDVWYRRSTDQGATWSAPKQRA